MKIDNENITNYVINRDNDGINGIQLSFSKSSMTTLLKWIAKNGLNRAKNILNCPFCNQKEKN